jgi:hypothetical protein
MKGAPRVMTKRRVETVLSKEDLEAVSDPATENCRQSSDQLAYNVLPIPFLSYSLTALSCCLLNLAHFENSS